MINVKIMHGNDSEMKACISGRSERIAFYLTEGSKSSGAFFFCGNLFLPFVEVIYKPAKYFAEFSVYIVFIIIFFRQVSSLHFEIASFMQNVMTFFAFCTCKLNFYPSIVKMK